MSYVIRFKWPEGGTSYATRTGRWFGWSRDLATAELFRTDREAREALARNFDGTAMYAEVVTEEEARRGQ